MKRSSLLLMGGAAVGGYLLLRRSQGQVQAAPQAMAGLGAADADYEAWSQVHNMAKTLYDRLVKDIEAVTNAANKSLYASRLYGSAASLQNALKLSYAAGYERKDYEAALSQAQSTLQQLQEMDRQIKADLTDPTGAASLARQQKIETDIRAMQAAAEPDRQLAEQGKVAYVSAKIGEGAGNVIGTAARGASTGLKAFLGQLPWWVYPVAIGGAALWFFGPALVARKAASFGRGLMTPKLAPLGESHGEYVFANNPKRRRRSRRR